MSLKYKRPYNISIVLFVIGLLVFSSCKKEKVTSLTFTEENRLIADSVLIELNLLKASSSNNQLSETINNTIEANIIETLQLDIDGETPKSVEEAIDGFKKQYALFNEQLEENALTFEATFDTEVLLNTSEIVSMALTSYLNTGGAHGNSYVKLLNFDTTDSKMIPTEDLLTESDAFFKLYKAYFLKNAQKQFPNMGFSAEDSFELPENIGFNQDGVLFLFNNYELEFLGQELFEFVIPSEEMIDHLTIQP